MSRRRVPNETATSRVSVHVVQSENKLSHSAADNRNRDRNIDQDWSIVQKSKPRILPMPLFRQPAILLREEAAAVRGSRVFTLKQFLSPVECEYYIKEAKKIGFLSLQKEFNENYRNNTRLSVHCPELADVLWKVLEPQFVDADLEGVTPFGFGNQGEWRAVSLGAWFKFSEYQPNTYFKAHMDSSYVIHSDLQSVYTIMIYLNDDFEGGQTAFYDRDDLHGFGKPVHVLNAQLGQAVLFNHDTRHAGLEVTKGAKYIMRTEVLFERTSEPYASKSAAHAQRIAKALFDKANSLELGGKFAEACDFHLQAMELQVKQGSFDWQKSREGSAVNIARFPLAKQTFSDMCAHFLSLKQISVLSCVSRRLYLMARDGALWKKLYLQLFPQAYVFESKTAIALQGWYPRFKSTWLINNRYCPILLDCGSRYTKIAMLGHYPGEKAIPLETLTILSAVGKYYDPHQSISGNGEYDKVIIGSSALSRGISERALPFINDELTFPHTSRFIHKLLVDRVKMQQHPVLLALPMHMCLKSATGLKWQHTMKKTILADLRMPSVGFVDSAVAVLADVGLTKGIVVSVGYRYLVVAGVRDRKRIFTVVAPGGLNPIYEPHLLSEYMFAPELDHDYVFNASSSLGPHGLPGFVIHALQQEGVLAGTTSSKNKTSSSIVNGDLLSSVVLCGRTSDVFGPQFQAKTLSLLSDEDQKCFRLVQPGSLEAREVISGAAVLAQTAQMRDLFKGDEPRDKRTGATPLLSACYSGDLKEVERLLEARANPENVEMTYRQTALMIASSRGHAEVCRVLLAYGADAAATDRDGWTAEVIAQNKHHTSVLSVLRSKAIC